MYSKTEKLLQLQKKTYQKLRQIDCEFKIIFFPDICMYLSIPRSFGAVAFTIMPLILTIDRIIATCTPIQYKNLKHCEVYYIGFLLVFPVIYALWILGFAILQQDTEKQNLRCNLKTEKQFSSSSNICVLSNCFGDAYYLYKVSTFSFAIILFPLQYFVNYRMKAMEYGEFIGLQYRNSIGLFNAQKLFGQTEILVM